MGALLVKLLAPQLQAMLGDPAQGLELRADIAMQTFMGSVVLGMAGRPRSKAMPKATHQADSRLSP